MTSVRPFQGEFNSLTFGNLARVFSSYRINNRPRASSISFIRAASSITEAFSIFECS